MKTPHSEHRRAHVHAEVIKAWADGAEIQFWLSGSQEWVDLEDRSHTPMWSPLNKYRVKPEPKPDIVEYRLATYSVKEGQVVSSRMYYAQHANFKCIFNGETGQLKAVELIK